MNVRIGPILGIALGILALLIVVYTVAAWTPLPVAEDENLFMPGSQPGTVGTFESPAKCDNCHGGYNSAVEPDYGWRGSMMAQAARDPLWMACLTVSAQDSVWALGNTNAADLCIRCHSPTGWLEGRSEPTNTGGLRGDDYWGVQCDFCHKMIDPFAANGQPDVPAETDPTAQQMADDTQQQDISVLSTIKLFDGTPFLDSTTHLPIHHSKGYVEHGSGQFFVDPSNAKRGPFADAAARHQMYYSRHHNSNTFCSSCHDVSNPVLYRVLDNGNPEEAAPYSYYHVERTSSEFMQSAYGAIGGSSSNIPGVANAAKCQDCHMRDVTGKGCNKKGVDVRDDLPLHDLTGGNQWISRILASADQSGPAYDSYNYAILSGQKYSGASVDVAGLQGYGQELIDGSDRAIQQLQMAATLSIVSEDTTTATVRVQNNAGHKLISGFPEGRRMFLNVKFFDADGNPVGSEINPYTPLVTSQDANGNEVYVSGGDLTKTNDFMVWETSMSSSLTGESKTFHFVLGTDRYKDNRIPPKGFDTSQMNIRITQPKYNGANAPLYFSSDEYSGGYDDVVVAKPSGTVSWYATLYYQTTSKDYIEFLRDEVKGTGTTTLTSPAPSGEPNAYIAQTDPYFTNIKGWGDAIWDLWLHNGGSAPVAMAQIGDTPAPPCTVGTPDNLVASGGRRSVSLSWDPVKDAEGYNVYYYQGGKYTFIKSVSGESFRDNKLVGKQTYCYAVTAYLTCADETQLESDYSVEACGTTK
jgi:hypothetical protein